MVKETLENSDLDYLCYLTEFSGQFVILSYIVCLIANIFAFFRLLICIFSYLPNASLLWTAFPCFKEVKFLSDFCLHVSNYMVGSRLTGMILKKTVNLMKPLLRPGLNPRHIQLK